MTPGLLPTPILAQTVATVPPAIQPPGPSSPSSDVERLRALVASTPTNVEVTPPTAHVEPSTTTEPAGESTFKTLGDSILAGISDFNSGYTKSLESINTKLQSIANDNNTLNLGNQFADIMELQVEIARWSMSVMGVDNASKAGTNTVKELSKGG